jgi:hypothetical protein
MEDLKFDGMHPNGFNPGFKLENTTINLTLSTEYQALFAESNDGKWFHTSEVQRQEEHEGYDLLYTLNSVYKITPNLNGITGEQEKYSMSIRGLVK